MNIDLAFIASKIYSLKQYSMVSEGELSNQNTKRKIWFKKQNIRMYALIIVFVILLFVLIILVITKSFSKNSSKTFQFMQPPISPAPTVSVIDQPSTPVIQQPISSPSGSGTQLQ